MTLLALDHTRDFFGGSSWNPHDLTDLKDGFVTAVNAPLDDKMKRMRAMRRYLRKHDVSRWARSFLTALGVPERSAAYNPGSPPAEV